MKQWQCAVLLTTMLFAAAVSAQCPDDEVKIGDECRDGSWIQSNLVGPDDRLLAFGNCVTTSLPLVPLPANAARCEMWFSEKKQTSSARALVAQIHFLSTAACGNGQNCVGDYARVGRLQLEFSVDNDGQGTGEVKIAAARSGFNAQSIGWIRWTVETSKIRVQISGGDESMAVIDSPLYFGKDLCQTSINTFAANGGKGGSFYGALDDAVATLAKQKSTTTTVGQVSLGGRESFATFSSNVPRAIGKTVGEWAKDIHLCDEFVPPVI
jgi:hypothetical protein